MFKLFLVASATAMTLFGSTVTAAENMTPGLGTPSPDATEVHASQSFRVYRWTSDVGAFFQINRPDGDVVTAFLVAKDGVHALGVGSLAATRLTFSPAADERIASKGNTVTDEASCPCSSEIVYQDATTTIVVVTGANGEVIEVITIRYEQDPK